MEVRMYVSAIPPERVIIITLVPFRFQVPTADVERPFLFIGKISLPLKTSKTRGTLHLEQVAFGFKGPADTQGPGGELSYEMARSPKGFMDILYLDEEMRVSRGNAGGVVVATRL